MGKAKKSADNVVRLEDTYDPADYIMVHKDYFSGMRAALGKFHTDGCICIYCAPRSAGAPRGD